MYFVGIKTLPLKLLIRHAYSQTFRYPVVNVHMSASVFTYVWIYVEHKKLSKNLSKVISSFLQQQLFVRICRSHLYIHIWTLGWCLKS